jgi:small-conductance mechanosensitive channel
VQNPVMQKLGVLLVGIVIIVFLKRVLQHLVRKRIGNQTVRYKVQKSIRFLSYLLFTLLVMVILGIRMEGMTVALGVTGAGIAFALQEVIVSIAGYIAIFTGGFYETGDRVQLGGVRGDVVDVGILRTTIMEMGDWVQGDLYNGKMVRVANSFIFKEPVYNYSGKFPFLWDELTIPIATTSDYKLARQLIETVVKNEVGEYIDFANKHWDRMTDNYKLEDAQVEPMVTFKFDENWITFTVRYVVDHKKRRTVQSALFEKILDALNERDDVIRVAYAAIEVTNVDSNS